MSPSNSPIQPTRSLPQSDELMNGPHSPMVQAHSGHDAFNETSAEACQSVAEYLTDTSNYHHDMLYDLFEVVRSTVPSHADALLKLIRRRASIEEVRSYLDQTLAEMHAAGKDSHALQQLYGIWQGIEVESEAPKFRPMMMDIRYLTGNAPFRVPAKPWTSVTDDDDLVSHLVSLYLTWDYPFFAFMDRKSFLKHMAMGNVDSDFCSPFLVNALLANACYYSPYSEAYTVPGDVRTKGADFLAEAERHMKRHQFERGNDIRLPTLQAILLLYERYSVSGNGDHGYAMLHRAIEMAESLGIINHKRRELKTSQMSEDMIISIKRTAWGLYQIDTVVHTNFLKPSRVNSVSIDRIARDDAGAGDIWTPYPLRRPARLSYLSQYFDDACQLSDIARDISRSLSKEGNSAPGYNQRKRELYLRLRKWQRGLPPCFDPAEKPAPHIILLWMRYHTLVINLCFDALGPNARLSHQNETSDAKDQFNPFAIAISSARSIASLARLQRTEFGMEHAHQFAMYAVNLALFALLEQKSFDILDQDFLTLTSAFSIIACRSQVGRNLFHLFKLSVRSRNQGSRVARSTDVPPGIKELFRQDSESQQPDRWDHYAEGLTKADGDPSYIDGMGSEVKSSAATGMHDMLERYERLSVGKEEGWGARSRRGMF
ncbi:hypothetical protein BO86DRAFT_402285 [Aspergillus japonicus CBS 114.51]|nr:hypothetical protein BO86DRAFT_402285 [Aspergillus japonicus CBS 114.51]RAH78941.1 hypothetical protein BO86DRAFT_402285 [Aspergillus japonicus CBS 114.51]